MKPNAAWKDCTPVPLEQLYSSILAGHMDLPLPLANAKANGGMLLSRLVAMPIQQQLQLQAIFDARSPI